MVSGACAGMAEHCVMFPFDTIKTRMQVAGGANGTVLETLRCVQIPWPRLTIQRA